MKFRKKEIFTIPNILTYIRILVVPFFAWMVLDTTTSENHLWWALGLFVFAQVTDVIDGIIARKCHMMSDIGKVMDPFADKLLQITAVITLTLIGNIHIIFPIIFVVKEAYMIIGAFILLVIARRKVTIQSNVWGKLSTVLFSMAVLTSFFHDELLASKVYLDYFLFSVSAVLTIIAAIQYTVKMIKEIKSNGGIDGLGGKDTSNDESADNENADVEIVPADEVEDAVVIDVPEDEIEVSKD